MNQTYVDHEVHEWEGSCAYSSIVGGFLHLQVSIISLPRLRSSRYNILPISRSEIHIYKVPSLYDTNFLRVLYTVVKEVLLLYTPAPLSLTHVALGDTTVGGFEFVVGT